MASPLKPSDPLIDILLLSLLDAGIDAVADVDNSTDYKARCSFLERRINAVAKKYTENEAQLAKAEKRCKKLEAARIADARTLREKNDELTNLTREVEVLRNQLVSNSLAQEAERKSIEERAAQAARVIAEKELALKVKADENQKLKEDIAQSERELAKASLKIKEKTQSIHKHREEMQKLRDAHSKINLKLDSLKQQLGAKRNECDLIRKKYETQKSHIASAHEKERAELSGELEKTRSAYQNLKLLTKSQSETESRRYTELEKRVESLRGQLEMTMRQLRIFQKLATRQKLKINKLRKIIHTKNQQLASREMNHGDEALRICIISLGKAVEKEKAFSMWQTTSCNSFVGENQALSRSNQILMRECETLRIELERAEQFREIAEKHAGELNSECALLRLKLKFQPTVVD